MLKYSAVCSLQGGCIPSRHGQRAVVYIVVSLFVSRHVSMCQCIQRVGMRKLTGDVDGRYIEAKSLVSLYCEHRSR